MQPDFQKESGRWFTQAKRDFDDAGIVKDSKIYNVACFLCQQAAEKALKAYLIGAGASTCASGSHVWKGTTGSLTAKPKWHH